MFSATSLNKLGVNTANYNSKPSSNIGTSVKGLSAFQILMSNILDADGVSLNMP